MLTVLQVVIVVVLARGLWKAKQSADYQHFTAALFHLAFAWIVCEALEHVAFAFDWFYLTGSK